MRRFDYYAPQTLQEAIEIFRRRGDGGRPLAGGTDLVVQMKEGAAKFPLPSYLVSLRRIPELKGIDFSESDGLRIGAAVTMMELAQSPLVRERFPLIAEAAALVGSVQTMNMATVGGNLCNAAPSADTAPPLLACDARARIVGPQGERTLPLEEFFLGPGQTLLQQGEILVDLRVSPLPRQSQGVYRRHTPRQQMDIAVVGVAAVVTLSPSTSAGGGPASGGGSGQAAGDTIERARIALGAVAPTPIRARQAEAALEGKAISDGLITEAGRIAAQEAKPISDLRGSAAFRRHLVQVMTERCLREAIARAKKSSA